MLSLPTPRVGLHAVAWLALPAAVDGARQYAFGHESTTLRRIVTGALLGVAMAISGDHVAHAWHALHSVADPSASFSAK